MNAVELSVVVPVHNDEANIAPLVGISDLRGVAWLIRRGKRTEIEEIES